MRLLVTGTAAAAVISAGALALAVPAASAAPAAPTVTAVTQISGRPDSGGNGNWATDKMTRTLRITSNGGSSWTADETDTNGEFATIPGAFAPNQGGTQAGKMISESLTGTFSGHISITFTASSQPTRAVPRQVTNPPDSSSEWFERAFPVGTTFTAVVVANTWGWSYTTNAGCVTLSKGRLTIVPQTWNDFASNDGGQGTGGTPAQGQIADFPSNCIRL